MTFSFAPLLARAYVPYSRLPRAAVAVLADGRWVPGVRVENASFPLTIPAVTAALAGAQATVGLTEVVGIVASHPLSDTELALFDDAVGRPHQSLSATEVFVSAPGKRPTLATQIDVQDVTVRHDAVGQALPAHMVGAAREIGRQRARVPNSAFPVGCLVDTDEGMIIPGVNIEFREWTRGLCAERTGLALALAYGLSPTSLYVSCVNAPGGTPCGACRQVIAELVPHGPIWLDMGPDPPHQTNAAALLPAAFVGASLRLPGS